MDANSISAELLECLKIFNALLARDELFGPSGIPKHIWNDELGRLRIWAANIGAHKKDQSSLDYRLRNASHVKSQIINLLQSLKMTLQDLEEVLVEVNEKHSATEEGTEDDEGKAEVAEIFDDLVQVVTNLYRLSILVRQPSQRDRFLRYRKDDAVGYEQFDRNHVQEKFRDADPRVIDRLGTAISNRRRHLKALERHRAKLGKGISHAHVEDHDGVSTVMSGTLATEYEETGAVARLEATSVSGESTTSYAASFLSGKRNMQVPPPPVGYGSDEPFECPYCFFITTITSRKSWARHVFRDLMPYVCIFPDCTTPNQMYNSQRNWSLHLQTHGHDPANPSSLAVGFCQLCHKGDIPSKAYERHVAEHLEELALFALPRTMQVEDEDDDEDDDEQQARPGMANSRSSGQVDDEDLLRRDSIDSTEEFWSRSVHHHDENLRKHIHDVLSSEALGSEPSSLLKRLYAGATVDWRTPNEGEAAETETKYAEEIIDPRNQSGEEAMKQGWKPLSLLERLRRGAKKAGLDGTTQVEDQQIPGGPTTSEQPDIRKAIPPPKKPRASIHLITEDGQEHELEWERCYTFGGMEASIIRRFGAQDALSRNMVKGRCQFIGPDNCVISPKAWTATVKPDMTIRIVVLQGPSRASDARPTAAAWSDLTSDE
ncbi:hypothetical protein Z517_07857 [Fonsecaea pedrosoi CBS 271.37]|uniref:C2H2-type domain-containing protein n=1 Tax=Fonsecaea pedrosoi CBS 271.37 TaxID=1442368 RepID=A0A0D2H074_9EURO|nr:uncharacterized protein Z517_07857 [Fonsecaea pedrosoi CBS 271.37]KIW78024.1 hypothetical protein Z517_07857 [Fonsecaea pedrosoi CBS 271.37]